jgi:AIR synthase-related protein
MVLDLPALAQALQQSRGLAHKRDIASVVRTLNIAKPAQLIPVGDDCAAIPDGDGFLLFAIEGFINEFVAEEPTFAGYCGVMVNVSDIYAMGGRPIAVVDALWSRDHAHAEGILKGMAEASAVYGVPVVGGHSNSRTAQEQLSVAILGRAQKLLTSFAAQPGDVLIAIIDLRGQYRPQFSNWDASTGSPPERLRADLELLPQLAESGLCKAAKDISQAGVLGTLLMLLECSGVGAVIHPQQVPMPCSVTTQEQAQRWLNQTFPSYGFLLAVAPQDVEEVLARFAARGLAAAAVGVCDDSHQVRLADDSGAVPLWNFRSNALIGCGPSFTD